MSTASLPLQASLPEATSQFVTYKRALNCGYQTEAKALRLLAHALAPQAGADLRRLTSQMIETFLLSRPRSRPRSYNHLLGVTRRFFEWAIVQGFLEQTPVHTTPRRNGSTRRPFLFDRDQVRALLALARALPDRSRAPSRGLVYETVFAMLFGLGLRVGEVSRLHAGDVDLDHAVLTIRESKFGKSRLVPFGPRMAARLDRYRETRFATPPDPEQALFSFTRRGCVSPGTISMTFRSLWPQLGLRMPPGTSTPRVHDLRHSFAVATLLRWYREGIDPNQRLLHLSTFMGHVAPTSTAVYLTITETLLQEADARFRAQVRSRVLTERAP